MNVLDIIILAIFAIYIFLGFRDGAVKSLFNLAGYFIAAIITYLYHQPVRTFLVKMTSIDDTISNFVAERFKGLGANAVEATVSTADLKALGNLPLPEDIKENIINFLTSSATNTTQNVVGIVSDFLMSIISMIILFIIVIIAIKIISSMLDLLTKLPIIKSFNTLGGVIFGAIKAYIVISIIYLVAITFFSINTYPQVQQMLSDSFLSDYFINYNIFMLWFKLIPQ